jgi:hypothetical protein
MKGIGGAPVMRQRTISRCGSGAPRLQDHVARLRRARSRRRDRPPHPARTLRTPSRSNGPERSQ